MARASSPPEATLANGCNGMPGFGREPEDDLVPGRAGDLDLDPGLRERQRRHLRRHRRGEIGCGGPPRRRDELLLRLDLDSSGTQVPVERSRETVVVLELGQAGPGRGVPRHDLGQVVAVLPPEIVEELASSADLVLAVGVVDDALAGVTHLGGHVGDLGGERSQASRGGPERGSTVEGGDGPADRVRGSPVPRHLGDGDGRGLAMGLGVGQEVGLVGEPGLLVDVGERGVVELADLEPQQIELAGPLPGITAELGQLALDPAQRVARLAQRREIDAGEAVERVALHGRGEQRLMIVLAVEVHEGGTDLGQLGDGGETPVDVGPAAALGRNDASDHHLAVPGDEASLDHRLLRSGSDDRGVGAAAHQELDGRHQQGLARPRLTRERGHPAVEHEGELVDDAELENPQLDQHQRSERPNLARRMAWKSRGPKTTSLAV